MIGMPCRQLCGGRKFIVTRGQTRSFDLRYRRHHMVRAGGVADDVHFLMCKVLGAMEIAARSSARFELSANWRF
jgi:hypothetical protein